MSKVAYLMTKEVMTVHPETPIGMAIKVLSTWKVTGLPVVDQEKNIKGIISEKDVLVLLRANEDFKGKTVGDYMTREVKFFHPDDDVDTVLEFLINSPIRRVPIVEDGKLVGLLSRSDIIKLIWKEHFENKLI